MKKTIVAIIAMAATACGGAEEKVVYLPSTDAPKTTAKSPTPTTEAQTDWLSDEDAFLMGVQLGADGPVYADDETTIETGYAICASLDAGATLEEISIIAVTQAGGDERILTLFAAVTASAVYNFCPEYSWLFE